MMHSGGSTGAITTLGSSTNRRIRLAEATRSWPLASWASLRRCFSSGQCTAMVGLEAHSCLA